MPKVQSEVWRFVALLGVAVFASSIVLQMLTVQFLGANVLSVNPLDLYAILGRNAPSSAQAVPSDLKSLGAGFFVALLAVLIFYPATVIAGFVAVFKSRKAACARARGEHGACVVVCVTLPCFRFEVVGSGQCFSRSIREHSIRCVHRVMPHAHLIPPVSQAENRRNFEAAKRSFKRSSERLDCDRSIFR